MARVGLHAGMVVARDMLVFEACAWALEQQQAASALSTPYKNRDKSSSKMVHLLTLSIVR
jgi:hypothetical protein